MVRLALFTFFVKTAWCTLLGMSEKMRLSVARKRLESLAAALDSRVSADAEYPQDAEAIRVVLDHMRWLGSERDSLLQELDNRGR